MTDQFTKPPSSVHVVLLDHVIDEVAAKISRRLLGNSEPLGVQVSIGAAEATARTLRDWAKHQELFGQPYYPIWRLLHGSRVGTAYHQRRALYWARKRKRRSR